MPYQFTTDDFRKFTEDILAAEGDQATLTAHLADMQGTITEAIAKDVAQTEKVTAVTSENERLKAANMDFFLRLGQHQLGEPENKKQEETEPIGTSQYMENYFKSLDKKE